MKKGLAADLAAYIEGLTITQGRLAGQPFHLLPWQKRFLRGAFADDVADAALSVGRGAGKTTFTAAIGCAAIEGPLMLPRAESVVVASSFEQAMICFRTALAFLEQKYDDVRLRFRIQDSVNRASITNRETGAMLRLIGSDPARALGLAPALIVADELSAWPHGNIGRMLAALETSRGKLERTTMLWIGTRPATSAHPFERMLSGGADYVQSHFAPPEDNPFLKRTWRKANPGLDAMPDLLAAIRKEAARAPKLDSEKMAQFRALRLNQGISDTVERFVLSASTWEGIERKDTALMGRYALGVDLGASASMSALSGWWPDSGALRVLGMFPENPSLVERGLTDGVGELYTKAQDLGELHTGGDEISDVVMLLTLALEYWGQPSKIVCDDWRQAELRQSLKACNLTNVPVELRRMGWKDGAQDLKLFRDSALDGRVFPAPSILMRSALSEARTSLDPAGNEKLVKSGGGRRRNARDDVLAAAVLAVAGGRRAVDGKRDRPMAAVTV